MTGKRIEDGSYRWVVQWVGGSIIVDYDGRIGGWYSRWVVYHSMTGRIGGWYSGWVGPSFYDRSYIIGGWYSRLVGLSFYDRSYRWVVQ